VTRRRQGPHAVGPLHDVVNVPNVYPTQCAAPHAVFDEHLSAQNSLL
jgi:hypothetical protein